MVPDYDEELREWLEYFMLAGDFEDHRQMMEAMSNQERHDFLEVTELVVRHDKLQDLSDWLTPQVSELNNRVQVLSRDVQTGADHDSLRSAQEDRDLYTIAYIGVSEEMGRLRDVVRKLYRKASGKDSF